MLKRKLIVLYVAWALMFAGCEPLRQDPKAELLASYKAFTAVVESLTVLQRAGRFSPDQTEHLTVIIHQGGEYLSQWQAAVEAGRSRPDLAAAVTKIINELLAVEAAAGGAS